MSASSAAALTPSLRAPPFIWSPNSPSVPTSVSVRSSFRSLFPSPSVRQNGSDVVVFHIKENLSDVAAVLFCKTGMGEEREKGDRSLARKAGRRTTHEIAAIPVKGGRLNRTEGEGDREIDRARQRE